MEVATACNFLTLVTTSLGILIGFLLIFLQFVPDRKRRIHDILTAKHLDLLLKTISPEETNEKIKDILEEKCIPILRKIIDSKKISIKIHRLNISLTKINLMFFSYTIFLFTFSILYFIVLKEYNRDIIDGILVYILLGLTIIDYIALIPMVYLSCVKDFELETPQNKES